MHALVRITVEAYMHACVREKQRRIARQLKRARVKKNSLSAIKESINKEIPTSRIVLKEQVRKVIFHHHSQQHSYNLAAKQSKAKQIEHVSGDASAHNHTHIADAYAYTRSTTPPKKKEKKEEKTLNHAPKPRKPFSRYRSFLR